MKKLLVFAVVAASFASCSNSGDKTVEEVKTSDTAMVVKPDTTLVKTDTTVKTTTTTDTLKK